MQTDQSGEYWVPAGTSRSDPLWSVAEGNRTSYTAWCFGCVRHWLRDKDLADVIATRKQRLATAVAEMAKPKTLNESLGWDYEGWWERAGKRHRELAHALASRALTVAELREVGCIGYRMLTPPNESFNAEEKIAEFAALLSLQQSIQLASSRNEQPPSTNAVDPSASDSGKPTTRD